MTTPDFNRIITAMFDHCTDTLIDKAREYATDDRLHNFKQAAHLQKITPVQALGGMMAKHTVSVYDMIAAGETYPLALWDEKIGDSINYLLLLRAMVEEDFSESRMFREHMEAAGKGFVEGIAEKEDEEITIEEAGKRVANAALNVFKSALGAKSPSEQMKEDYND